MSIKINCKPCMGDKHDECTDNNCLCKENKHGGNAEKEILFTNQTKRDHYELLHEVIASCKIGKICLIRNKWQFLYPIGNSYKIGVIV